MFNSNNGVSLSDIAAVMRNNDDGGFGGNGAWWIILVFAFMWFGGFGGNGWGANNGSAGSNFFSAINTDYLANGLRDIQSGLTQSFQTLNNELLNGFCDNRNAFAQNTASIIAAVTNGFNTQNLTNLQNSNDIRSDIYANTVGGLQNTQALQMSLNQMSNENRSDFCAMNNNNSNNTRDIIDAINSGNQMLANMIQQDKVDAMQNKIDELQAQVQQQNLAASQAAQNNYLVNTLRPLPVPAYYVQNPYCNCGGNYATYNMANM